MKYLDTDTTRFERLDTGHLSVTVGGSTPIAPISCMSLFPLSDPEHYISIQRAEPCDEPEVGIVRRLADLSDEQRALVVEDLDQRRFLPEILNVSDVLMVNGMDEWHVETDRGEKTFFVSNRKDNIMVADSNMILITDIDKCRYRIPDYGRMPARAAALIGSALP